MKEKKSTRENILSKETVTAEPSKHPRTRGSFEAVVLDVSVERGAGRLFVLNPRKGTEVATELGGSYANHVRGIVPEGSRWYYKSYTLGNKVLNVLEIVEPINDDPSLYSLADLPPED